MNKLYLSGRLLRLSNATPQWTGGEADVFKLDPNRLLKIYKQPDHADYTVAMTGNSELTRRNQEGARQRLLELQAKLPAFPKNVPSEVVTPEEFVTNDRGEIVGYVMRFIKDAETLFRYGSDFDFCEKAITDSGLVEFLRKLHRTLRSLSNVPMVIGDANAFNVLIANEKPYLIDADSYSYGSWQCGTFTPRYVDPMLCIVNPKDRKHFILSMRYTSNSDWYSFAVWIMELLLHTNPYGGTLVGGRTKSGIIESLRQIHRITVFHPEVRYTKQALPLKVLPDDLLDLFHRMFVKDQRGEFPIRLLDQVNWTTCKLCGRRFARGICPFCKPNATAAVKYKSAVKGKVSADRIFATSGRIVSATTDENEIVFAYDEGGVVRRENKEVVYRGQIGANSRVRVSVNRTLIANSGKGHIVSNGKRSEIHVDSFARVPMVDLNAKHYYWIENGILRFEGEYGFENIGEVMEGQTIFWVGPKFGMGMTIAGSYQLPFVFGTSGSGINDSVSLPKISGRIVDMSAYFTNDRGWLLCASVSYGKEVRHCFVLNEYGKVLGSFTQEVGQSLWISSIRGKAAIGAGLLCATDEGIVRVEVNGGTISETKSFPDTEPFVAQGDHLLASKNKLFVVKKSEIWSLAIS